MTAAVRYDPFQIFRGGKSPAGLYARRKWLVEAESTVCQKDFNETVLSLLEGQCADGSWGQSPIETIRRLFGLHLTVRERTEAINRALEWLADQTLTYNLSMPYLEDLAPDAFRELPFINAGQPLVFVCATLFLAAVFQQENDERVDAHYRLLTRWLGTHAEEEDLWPEKSNILRALVVHQDHIHDPAAVNLVDELERNQKSSGIWPAPVPFFLTVNALAHLDSEAAGRQWQKALPLLSNVQKKDGSWGSEDCQWNTFLVVHALKNRKCL